MANEYLQYLRAMHKGDTIEKDLHRTRFIFYTKTGYGFAALRDKKVTGYILAQPIDWAEGPTIIYLDFMVVPPEFRWRGVGSALLNAVKEQAKKHAIHDLWTTLNVDNEASKRLLVRNGFEVREWLFVRLSLGLQGRSGDTGI